MPAADTEIREETDVVEAWRAEQLELAGYGAAAAAILAGQHEVDLHVAIEMVAHGCPPDLAVKILL
jgi:ABC-type phosphate/phosphonate transport system substrate-binding protein